MSTWGAVELEREVLGCWRSLDAAAAAQAKRAFGLLEDTGVLLGEPHTRQLSGKLRELRFNWGRTMRVTHFIASGRRTVLLTVFSKSQRRESAQIERAERAMLAWESEDRQWQRRDGPMSATSVTTNLDSPRRMPARIS